MKKILCILFIALLVGSNVQAQTFSQTQNRVNTESAKLEKRLEVVKSRIFYLEVTLNEKKTKARWRDFEKLEKEQRFAPDDLKKLNLEKTQLEQALADLQQTGLSGIAYRTASDVESNLPEQMSSGEFKRRSRTQVYKLSEGNGGPKLFKGLVSNEKIGQGETASFYISRTDIKGVPTFSLILGPNEKKEWLLPVGTYQVYVVCGSSRATSTFHVDPRVKNWFNDEYVYWAVKKNLSDW